jgi:hypothetical protein
VFKKLFLLLLIVVCALSLLLSGCDIDKTTTTTPNIKDIINDIQLDEVDLNAAMNATLPGGGTVDDLIDKSLLETTEP